MLDVAIPNLASLSGCIYPNCENGVKYSISGGENQPGLRPGVYPFFDSAQAAGEESAATSRRFSLKYRLAKQTRKEVAAP